MAEWDQVSIEFETVRCSFAADEPHPNDDTLQWLQWNDKQIRLYPQWAEELQSVCPCDYRELARRMYLSWQWCAVPFWTLCVQFNSFYFSVNLVV